MRTLVTTRYATSIMLLTAMFRSTVGDVIYYRLGGGRSGLGCAF